MRIRRFFMPYLDSTSLRVEFAEPSRLSCKSWPGSCTSQALGSAEGPHLAPVPRMRGTLLGKGRCGLALLLYWACAGPQVSRFTAASFNSPYTPGDAGEGHGCCARTCILWNQGDTLSSSLVVNTAAGFWFKYLVAPSVLLLLGSKAMANLDSIIKSRDSKSLSSQSYGFSSRHVWMYELDHKEGWASKNWCFWTVVLEKTLGSPLDCKEIQPVHPKGNQSWIFTERTDAEVEAPVLWPPDVKNWLTGKDPDYGKDWR